MEDLQEALEDAQYFNAIHKKGPKSSARIEAPSMLDLKDWLRKNEDEDLLNNVPSLAADNLGLFLFLKYCATNGDLPSALFIESVAKFKALSSGRARQVALADIKRLFTADDSEYYSNSPSEPAPKPSLVKDQPESALASKPVPEFFEFIDETLVRKVSPTAAVLGAKAYDELGERYCNGTWPPTHPCSILPARISPPLDAEQAITFSHASSPAAADAAAQLMADAKASSPPPGAAAVHPASARVAPAPPDSSAPSVGAARVGSGSQRGNHWGTDMPPAPVAPLQLPFHSPHLLIRMTLKARESDQKDSSSQAVASPQNASSPSAQVTNRARDGDVHIVISRSSSSSAGRNLSGGDGNDSTTQEVSSKAPAPVLREALDLAEALVFEYLARKHGPLFLNAPPGFFDKLVEEDDAEETKQSDGDTPRSSAGASSKVHPDESTSSGTQALSTQSSLSRVGSKKGGAWSEKGSKADADQAVRFTPKQDSNAYYKWLQIQCVKAQPVGEADFTQFRVLGRGGFGLVYGCMRKTTGHLYAMKTMDRRRVKMKRANDLCWNERVILGRLNSPFIVCLKYAFVSKQDLFLIMDLMLGGDLSFWLSKKKRFNRDETRYHAGRIYLALRHMHKHRIVYRDLKPENILMDETGRTKLSDLGLACLVTPNMRGACGTRGYIAPEMLFRDARGHPLVYNETVDWFSFGCVLFELRIGCSPFRTSHAKKWMVAQGEAQQQQQQPVVGITAATSTTQQTSGTKKSTNLDGTSTQKVTTAATEGSPSVVAAVAFVGASGATGATGSNNTPAGAHGSLGSGATAGEASVGRSGGSRGAHAGEVVAQQPVVRSRKDRVDQAVMEMEVRFPSMDSNSGKELGEEFVSVCKALLAKNPTDRLGFAGAEEISNHPWFRNEVDLEGIQQDIVAPPITPGKDIHAHSQTSIGFFSEDLSRITITEEDDDALHSWNFSSTSAFNKEVIGVFKEMDVYSGSGNSSSRRGGANREGGHAAASGGSCCCVIS